MEATIRVLTYVIEASWDIDDLEIQMQPSAWKHTAFTDFLFVLKVTGYSLLINIHEEILTTILKHTEHAKL